MSKNIIYTLALCRESERIKIKRKSVLSEFQLGGLYHTYAPEFLSTFSLELQRFHAGSKEDTVDVLEPAISKTMTEPNFSLLVKPTTLFVTVWLHCYSSLQYLPTSTCMQCPGNTQEDRYMYLHMSS